MTNSFQRGPFGAPDPFSLSPLVAMLPVHGRVGGLASLTSSLFARYEKVQALLKEVKAEENRPAHTRLTAEGDMLRQVLDWLSVRPGEA